MTQGQPYAMSLDLRDAFNNPCEPEDWEELRPLISVSVTEVCGSLSGLKHYESPFHGVN